jgi:hypothetical protein
MGKERPRVKVGSAASERLEQRIAFVQEYIKLWRQFFEMFAEGFEGRKILKRDEEEFARVLNSLAHHHYRFTTMAHPEMSNTDGILKVLCEVTSLSHLKGISEAQVSKIQIDWHSIFIDMNKALGRLLAQRPLTPEEQAMAKRGGPPPEEPEGEGPPSDSPPEMPV